MIIHHFGQLYTSTPIFGTVQAVDDWAAMRPAVAQLVSGAGGTYDFFAGNVEYPPSPITIIKRYTITASTYDGIETALDSLRAATIAAPDLATGSTYRLWGLPRGGDPGTLNDYRWTPAKCTFFKAAETYVGGNYVKLPVELHFHCPEGVWYGALQTDGPERPAGATGFELTNNGNYPALLYVKVTPLPGNMTSCQLINSTPPDVNPTWTFGGTVTSGNDLEVDARNYTVENNAVDAYSDLTVGSDQVAWMWLHPGVNNLTVTLSTAATVYTEFYDTYIL